MGKSFSIKLIGVFCLLFFICSKSEAATKGKLALAIQSYTKGVELTEKKKWQEALDLFEKSIELNPTYVASYIEFARTAVLSGKRTLGLEKIVEGLEQVKSKEGRDSLLKERDNLSEVFYTNDTFQKFQSGLNYFKLDRNVAAIEALESALKTEPDNLLILIAYARVLVKEQRYKDSMVILERAFFLNNNNKDVRFMLAEGSLEMSPERTIQLLRPMVSLGMTEEKTAILNARALSASKRNKEAIDFLKPLVDEHSSWVFSQLWLGKFYSLEADDSWSARKYLMTFQKRAESELNSNKLSEEEKAIYKTSMDEAAIILNRVNDLLE
ncbi:MAG: tetratricopeptide repeat protein [Oligoflexia bacterium]|nr:tetratricopeptide repeat protein [Oligoflexia bacterium]